MEADCGVVVGALLVVAGASLAPLAEEKQPTILSARVLWVAIGLMGVLVLWSRLAGLDQSLWHDEVFSVVHYITAGPETIVTGHWVPNNHVLYSLLSFGTTRGLGESEVTFRLGACSRQSPRRAWSSGGRGECSAGGRHWPLRCWWRPRQSARTSLVRRADTA